MKNILLDTNAFSALMVGKTQILDVITDSEIIYLSIFVLAELQYGFKGGKKESENLKMLKAFTSKSIVKILNATQETAEIFAFVKNHLKLKGKHIPINDVWIASHAIESGSVLITYDAHFDQIENLRVYAP